MVILNSIHSESDSNPRFKVILNWEDLKSRRMRHNNNNRKKFRIFYSDNGSKLFNCQDVFVFAALFINLIHFQKCFSKNRCD